MASNKDTTTEIPQITEEALAYFAAELQKSGRYNVTPASLGTAPSKPLPKPPDRFSMHTSTPVQYTVSADTGIPPPLPPPPIGYLSPNVGINPNSSSIGNTFTYGMASSTSRIPRLPPFSGESLRGDCEFDVWKYDLTCLLHSGAYPQHLLLEAIRNSLKGRARSVLLHLGELANVYDILAELEALYGNVSTKEKLKEQFYMATQQANETVADYSLRLEQLLHHSSLQFDSETKNEMLRNRLWSGLRDRELKNSARYKFESLRCFNTLRKELRKIEQEMESSDKGHRRKAEGREELPTEEVACNMTLVESKILKQLESLSTNVKTLNSKIDALEKEKLNPMNNRLEALEREVEDLRRNGGEERTEDGAAGGTLKKDVPAQGNPGKTGQKSGKPQTLNWNRPPRTGR